MKSTFSILFYIDRSKTSERNECIIRCRITCNGASSSFSTGLHTFPDDWQSKIGRIKVAANRANAVNLQLITTRADMALTAYCDAVAQGFTHLEAENIASEVLYQGLHFSKYDTLVAVLENEFERELPAPLPDKLAPILLSNKAVQATFDKFGLTDTFASDEQYDRLYTELTGTIVLLTKSNHLPIIGQTEG